MFLPEVFFHVIFGEGLHSDSVGDDEADHDPDDGVDTGSKKYITILRLKLKHHLI